jgi:hypothetical protein
MSIESGNVPEREPGESFWNMHVLWKPFESSYHREEKAFTHSDPDKSATPGRRTVGEGIASAAPDSPHAQEEVRRQP